MKKARYILLICTLTAAAWSFPGVAFAKTSAPTQCWSSLSSFDGHGGMPGTSAFDGH
jgi:hypothetical protein